MNPQKIKIAILGVGRWGVHFVRNFLSHPETEVVAIVDPNAENLAQCRDKFALANQPITLASSWESIRNSLDFDAVVVVTPASTHYGIIADALELGYHVLSEKPLTLDPYQCLELKDLALARQKILLVDHTYLFHPVVLRGKEILTSGNLGQMLYGYASRTHLGPVRQDVDALWDLAIHDIAIFNAWLGQTPSFVQAQGTSWLQSEIADLVYLTLTYPQGFQAFIHLCWLNPDKQRRLCVVTEQGTLIFDEMSQDSPLTLQRGHFTREGKTFLPTEQSLEVIKVEKAEPLKTLCNTFVEAIRTGNGGAISSGQVGAELVQILSCLTQSLQAQGKVVSVPSLDE
jgi:predicted dehydrogenase